MLLGQPPFFILLPGISYNSTYKPTPNSHMQSIQKTERSRSYKEH